jgi:hypothetical protein
MILSMIVPSGPRVAAKRSGRQCRGQASHLGGGVNAPPRCGQFAQAPSGPHLHDGPQLQAFGWEAHVQACAQVQGLHLQVSVIGELLWFGLWSACGTMRIGWTIERSG